MQLTPRDAMQTNLKEEAIRNLFEAYEISAGLYTKSSPSTSPFLLAVVVGWLAVIFINYSVFAPRNLMSAVALLLSALSVYGALILIWEPPLEFPGAVYHLIHSEPIVQRRGRSHPLSAAPCQVTDVLIP